MAGINKKIILAIVGLGICFLGILGLIMFGHLLSFLMIFPWIVEHLVNAGFDIWLARLITVPIASIMVIGLGLALSFSSAKRNAGLAIFAAGLMLWSLAMYQMSKDHIFDPISGMARKCYAVTPKGYEVVPCSWNVHPIYGSAVLPATKEMATAEWMSKNDPPKVQKIEPDSNLRFFAQDGSPLVWYYEYPDGRFDLFAQPGKHPQLNVALKPVDAGIVQKILNNLEKASAQIQMEAAPKNEPEYKVNNLVFNGDFTQRLEGWNRQIGDVSKGYSQAEVVSFEHGKSGKALHIMHKGEGYVQYLQVVPVVGYDLIFSVSFQPSSREGNMVGFSGSGVAQVGLIYLDKDGSKLGETILVNYVKNPFADSPMIGVPRREGDTNTKHFIEIAGGKYYQNYQIDLRKELESNLMGVNPDNISKIAIILWCGATGSQAGSELWATDISLTKK